MKFDMNENTYFTVRFEGDITQEEERTAVDLLGKDLPVCGKGDTPVITYALGLAPNDAQQIYGRIDKLMLLGETRKVSYDKKKLIRQVNTLRLMIDRCEAFMSAVQPVAEEGEEWKS
jgi:hypothetical protein